MLNFLNIENGIKKLREILASYITYDNTSSGLTSTDVQSAIDEIASGTGVTVDACIDGGFANSVYTPEQCFDGGGA